ncbi:MAPEG family protein [Hyphomonas sp.]|uniref:MAPEG family protein n=1 Tax=Hyphomonas sp. TaxID=87 RepID=UPI0032ECEF47|tara:strand:- start:1149 stop:1541 length:393 start_codon:yes stop_codon:yes gene_type:complete
MTAFAAATLYFGLFGLLMLALKINVGRVRGKEKVMFGDGANEAMQRAIRVQGNAVEDVPIVLIGIAGLAALSAPVMLIHALGGSFLAGRILHAIGLGGSSGSSFGRMVGTLVTLIVQLVTAGACIWFALT